MRWSHLRATLWLRWRILANRVKRSSKLGNALFGLLLVLAALASFGVFGLALLIGVEVIPEARPGELMIAWIALAVGYLFFWMIGLLTDLQRSDAMSFKNLLHLPVSLHWVFLYNYLSSYVSLSVAIFLPASLGLWLASVITIGPRMLLMLPLVLGYFGMVTALTYQLRGWLARLMEDKRRGRNIVALVTVLIIVLVQVPNLLNMRSSSGRREQRREKMELTITAASEGPEAAEAQAKLDALREEEQRNDEELERQVTFVSKIVPIGWLPYGMRATFEGRTSHGLLCMLGLVAISGASLRRSYRKTMASVVGSGTASAEEHATASDEETVDEPVDATPAKSGTLLVQRTVPFFGEAPSSIATATLQGLLRAPEAKMLLLSPVILFVLFGFMLANNPNRDMLERFAHMTSLGAVAMGLVSILQLMQNQFGIDRAGFRAFVLSPVPRHEILLGKNLAIAPLGLGIGVIALIGLQILIPTGAAHFVAGFLQLGSAFLLMCMVGNTISILSPMRLKEHGWKAANAQWRTVVWQLLSLLLVPLALSPLMLPAGIEFLLLRYEWAKAVPIHALLHAAGLVVTWFTYRWVLRRQGELLEEREQRILDILTHD